MSGSSYRVVCRSSKADVALMAKKNKYFVTRPEKASKVAYKSNASAVASRMCVFFVAMYKNVCLLFCQLVKGLSFQCSVSAYSVSVDNIWMPMR
jgi:hypothetical protein